jgi:hypothetical protein
MPLPKSKTSDQFAMSRSSSFADREQLAFLGFVVDEVLQLRAETRCAIDEQRGIKEEQRGYCIGTLNRSAHGPSDNSR